MRKSIPRLNIVWKFIKCTKINPEKLQLEYEIKNDSN
jgi:hypothetical protein